MFARVGKVVDVLLIRRPKYTGVVEYGFVEMGGLE